MAHDTALRSRCEQLYVTELMSPEEVCETTGVPLATFYRWRKDGNWGALRDLEMGVREKLGKLMKKLIDEQLKDDVPVDAQKLHGLINMLDKYQKTGTVRERLTYVDDAELLLETMKEMDAFSSLLEDQAVLSELGERLKEKRRHKD